MACEQVVKEAFEKIDSDHGGTVDVKELKKALFQTANSRQSREILEARFSELDFDSSGEVTLPEFM